MMCFHLVKNLHKWEKEKCLELHAPFQRNPVWSEKNRSYLIDTILNGYPVPEVYVQVKTDKYGNTKYVVVDGQQRISSILMFIEGEYEILESESETYGGKEFKDLPDGVKKDFWDFSIVTRELKTDSDEEVRNVFRRLNRYVVPLNSQELRNATFRGKFILLMKDLSNDDFLVDNKIVSASDVRRMRDVEFISELFLAMMEGIQNGTKTLDKFYKLYDVEFENEQNWKKKFFKIQNQIIDVLGDLKSTKWRSRSDFYSLFIAFSNYIDNYYFPQENYENIAFTIFNSKG